MVKVNRRNRKRKDKILSKMKILHGDGKNWNSREMKHQRLGRTKKKEQKFSKLFVGFLHFPAL